MKEGVDTQIVSINKLQQTHRAGETKRRNSAKAKKVNLQEEKKDKLDVAE